MLDEVIGPSPQISRFTQPVDVISDTDFAGTPDSGIDEESDAPRVKKVVADTIGTRDVNQGMRKLAPVRCSSASRKAASPQKRATAQNNASIQKVVPLSKTVSSKSRAPRQKEQPRKLAVVPVPQRKQSPEASEDDAYFSCRESSSFGDYLEIL